MKYVILHYFFMVHLCKTQMSANTIRHKSTGEAYDIDGFINQLLASRKFDELAEKVADKAAVRIMSIEAPARLERFSDVNKINKTTENAQQSYRDQVNRDYEKEYDKDDSLNNIKLRNDNGQDIQGMIDTQAVMMDENTSQSNSLTLKYKYLTRNAYEKKVFSERGSEKGEHPFPRNDQKEDQPKRNENAISAEKFKHHETKVDERIHQDTSEINKHGSSKNELTDEKSHWRHDTRGDDREDIDSNRKGRSNDNPHSDMDGERYKNSKKNDHDREDRDIRHEQKHSREAQNSRPEFKSIVKNDIQESGNVDNSTEEEKAESSSIEEEIVETVPPSDEKPSEEIEKAEEEPEKTSTSDENVENEVASHVQLRSQDDIDPNTDENKITSDNQQDGAAYGYVYRSEEHKEQVDEEPKTEEQRTEEQKTEEQKSEEQKTEEQKTEEQKTEEQKTEEQKTEEQQTEEQNTQEQSDSNQEEKPPVPYKPIIRREGDKLYTYVEAPEYQDYHEQMAKMLKEHPVNPADFI